jgi:UDP-glucose 4-epimerase
MTTPPTAAVVGAGGMIGSALTTGLRRLGVPVVPFTRERPACPGGQPHPGRLAARTIFYLASRISPSTVDRVAADRADFVRLLDEVGRSGRRPTVVFGGSGGTAYDRRYPPPYQENSPVGPADPYGIAKIRLEDELRLRAHTVRPVVLRLANVYGPRADGPGGFGVVAQWLQAVAEQRPVQLYGDPRTGRDHVYVGDVVEAMVAVHRAADPPALLNIGAGQPVSLGRLLEIVGAVTGQQPVIERQPARPYDRPTLWLDVSRARAALGWQARTPLRTGITHVWHAVRDSCSSSVTKR